MIDLVVVVVVLQLLLIDIGLCFYTLGSFESSSSGNYFPFPSRVPSLVSFLRGVCRNQYIVSDFIYILYFLYFSNFQMPEIQKYIFPDAYIGLLLSVLATIVGRKNTFGAAAN